MSLYSRFDIRLPALSKPPRDDYNDSGVEEKLVKKPSHMPYFSLQPTPTNRRIMRELMQIEQTYCNKPGPNFTVELEQDNLFEWFIQLHVIDPDSLLCRDLMEIGMPFIELHLIIPKNYPHSPPFMRVSDPQIDNGYVMRGGAICMEMLLPQRWKSSYTIEGLVMQFAANVVEGNGRIALPRQNKQEYSLTLAMAVFGCMAEAFNETGNINPDEFGG